MIAPAVDALRDALHDLYLALGDAGAEWFGWGSTSPPDGFQPDRDIREAARAVRCTLEDLESGGHSFEWLDPNSPAHPDQIRETLRFAETGWQLREREESELRELLKRAEIAREHLIGRLSQWDRVHQGGA